MSNRSEVVSYKQAKSHINTIGISLFIYTIVLSFFHYGLIYLNKTLETEYIEISSFARFSQSTLTNNTIILLIAYGILYILCSVIPFAVSQKVLNLNIRDYLKNKKIKIGTMIGMICIAIGIQLFMTSLVSFIKTSGSDFSLNLAMIGDFRTVERIIVNVIYIVVTCFIIPICDEYVFRGIVQRELGHFSRYFGVFASAFLYAIVQRSLVDAIPAFALGIFLSLMTLKYHSIIPAINIQISIHIFYYLMSLVTGHYAFIVVICVILIYIIALFSLFNQIVRMPSISMNRGFNKDFWKMLLTSVSIVICIIIFIADVVLSYLI